MGAARALEQAGDWSGAVTQYRRILERTPHRADTRLRLARVLVRAGQVDEALAEYRSVSGSLPARPLIRFADALADRGRWAEAVEVAGRVAEDDDAYADALDVLVKAHAGSGELERAEELASAARERLPGSVEVAMAWAEVASARAEAADDRGELPEEHGLWDEAVARWEQARDLVADPPPRIWLRLGRAQRRAGDYAAADQAVQAGRDRYPDYVRLAAAHAFVFVEGYRDAGEDARHGWKERIIDLESELRSHLARDDSLPMVWRALGNLQLALRQWEEAATTWEVVEQRFGDLSDDGLTKQARAHCMAGIELHARAALPAGDPARIDTDPGTAHFDKATRALERVAPEGRGSRAYRSTRRLLGRHLGRLASSEVANAGQLLLETGEVAEGERALVGALFARSYDERVVEAMRPALRALGRLAETPARLRRVGTEDPWAEADPRWDSAPPVPEDEPRQTVLVSGFLYSGSGAVHEYLRDHPGFHEPFGTRETWFLKKTNNFGLLLENEHQEPMALASLGCRSVLTNVFGFWQTSSALMQFFTESDDDLTRMAGLTTRFVDALTAVVEAGADDAAGGVEQALSAYLDGIVSALTPPGEVALVNNVVPAFHLYDYMDLYARARAVVTIREPRDQYVSQRLESPYPRPVPEFVAMMEQRYADFERLLDDPRFHDRVTAVRFEEFVMDDAARRDLLKRLGVPENAGPVEGSTFDPSRSQQNVGIHRNYAAQDEVAAVSDALGAKYDRLVSMI